MHVALSWVLQMLFSLIGYGQSRLWKAICPIDEKSFIGLQPRKAMSLCTLQDTTQCYMARIHQGD